jgi:hypothetical protein
VIRKGCFGLVEGSPEDSENPEDSSMICPNMSIADALETVRSITIDTQNLPDEYTGLREFLHNPRLAYRVFKIPATEAIKTRMIPRNGDVLLGFYAQSAPVAFNLTIPTDTYDKVRLTKHSLEAGAFAYAIENKASIPIISTAFTPFFIEITEGNASDLYILYAFLQDGQRRAIAMGSFVIDMQDDLRDAFLTFSSGCVRVTKERPIGPINYIAWV